MGVAYRRGIELLPPASMTVSYSVTRVASNDAIPNFRRIWADSLNGRGDAEERPEYAQTPALRDDVFVIAAHEGALPDRIVGTAGFEIRAFAFGGRELRVGLGRDLSVEPAHLTLLTGLHLLRAVQHAATEGLDLFEELSN